MDVGVDDSAAEPHRAVTFEVYGDGRLLARSTPLTRGNAAQALSVDTRGVIIVELVARAPGVVVDEQLPVSWAEAAFHH